MYKGRSRLSRAGQEFMGLGASAYQRLETVAAINTRTYHSDDPILICTIEGVPLEGVRAVFLAGYLAGAAVVWDDPYIVLCAREWGCDLLTYAIGNAIKYGMPETWLAGAVAGQRRYDIELERIKPVAADKRLAAARLKSAPPAALSRRMGLAFPELRFEAGRAALGRDDAVPLRNAPGLFIGGILKPKEYYKSDLFFNLNLAGR